MSNPKGNPELTKYKFKTDRQEACTAQINVRITPSVKAKLKNIDDWQEQVRKFLDTIVETKSA